MLSKEQAQKLAEAFIEKKWSVSVRAIEAIFISADSRKENVIAATYPGDEPSHKLLENCRDEWSVTVPTILKDGSVFCSTTLVTVDAETGEAKFFE